jgi:hypothetical protein
MCSPMMHGEGGGKRPTLTKRKMKVCALTSKQVLVHLVERQKIVILMVKCKDWVYYA